MTTVYHRPGDQQVRCQNPYCPSARYGRPALICIVEAPLDTPLTVRTRCRRCKSFQRIQLSEAEGPT